MTGIVAFAGRAMGSPLRLQVATAARATPRPERLWARVQAEFRTSDAELSCYRPDSALSQLNEDGRKRGVVGGLVTPVWIPGHG